MMEINSKDFSNIELDVLYRDKNLLFIEKPSGMVVHRGWAKDKTTVSDIVRDQIVGDKVYALHRLDRGTSGIMGFALDAEAASKFQELFLKSDVTKEYIALVRGPFSEPVHLDHAIAKEKGGQRVSAITKFFPLGRSGRWSLVKASPLTGRPHQIRKHLKHLSLPIIGDTKYGKGEINRLFKDEYQFGRLALHASLIEFVNPFSESGEKVTIKSSLTGSFKSVVEKLFPDLKSFG